MGWAARAAALLYLLTFGLALGESAFLFDLVMPGETGMILVGAAGQRAELSLPLLIVCAAFGAIAGDSISFALGRRWGTDLANRWPLTRRHVAPKFERATRHLEQHGGRSVFLARWVGALRALVPAVAGASRMPYRTFIGWSALAAVSWTTVMVSAGWYFGDHIARFIDWLGWGVSLVVVAGLGLWWWRHRHHSEGSRDPERTKASTGRSRSSTATPR